MITTDEELVISAAVYTLLLSIEKDPFLRSTRKKIVRNIQKQIAIYRNKTDVNKYLELVNTVPELLAMVRDNLYLIDMDKESLYNLSPIFILTLIRDRHTKYFEAMEIDTDALTKLEEGYQGFGKLLPTLMVINRLFLYLPKLVATDTIDTIDRLVADIEENK